MIFPEGATTNGDYLLKFKKGAFACLKPVKPYITKADPWWGKFGGTRGDAFSFFDWTFMMGCSWGIIWSEHIEMPVFAPNEYFWKNFADGKDEKEKVAIFAEAVREAMAEVGGFKLSDSTVEDKFEYKKMIWGKNAKAD